MSAPAKPEREKTGYVVLVELPTGSDAAAAWEVVDNVNAASASAAIRAVATDHVDGSRSYVAVPERSWRPVTAKIDTKTVLTLS